MLIIKKSGIVFLFLIMAIHGIAQDQNFSQFFNCPVYYNPAFAGYNDYFCKGNTDHTIYNHVLRINNRMFKYNIGDDGFRSSFISYDVGISPKNTSKENSIGVGVIGSNTVDGILHTQTAGIALASGILLGSSHKVRAGISFNTLHKSLSVDDLTFSSQINAVNGKTGSSGSYGDIPDELNWFKYYDAGIGVVYSYGQCGSQDPIHTFIAGFSVHHFYNTSSYTLNNTTDKLPVRLVGQLNYNTSFNFGPNVYNRLSAAVLFEKQGNFFTSTIGANYYLSPFLLGFWLRNTVNGQSAASAIIEAGYDIIKKENQPLLVKAVVGYDFCFSNRKYTYGDSIEFTLILKYNYMFE
jgi:type IX secretion system PorP/SprF family membrane protein